MTKLREFSSPAEPEILDGEAIATREGRQLPAVPRNVLEAFQESLMKRDELYRSLAQ